MSIKNLIAGHDINHEKYQRVRELRRDMTPAEKVLWEELRRNKLGFHFRRQQVIEGFIMDFYCHSASLVVEVDGDVHQEQKEYDSERDKVMENKGLRVVRYTNEEVLFKMTKVIKDLGELLGKR